MAAESKGTETGMGGTDTTWTENHGRREPNPEHAKSPGDVKIAQTVVCIIEEFFRLNPEVLLYMCSTDKGQQAQRSRLFLRWFNGYEQQKHYLIRSTEIRGIGPDNKPIKEYVALIIQRTHPLLDEIVQRFDDEIQMFNDNKPTE